MLAKIADQEKKEVAAKQLEELDREATNTPLKCILALKAAVKSRSYVIRIHYYP